MSPETIYEAVGGCMWQCIKHFQIHEQLGFLYVNNLSFLLIISWSLEEKCITWGKYKHTGGIHTL